MRLLLTAVLFTSFLLAACVSSAPPAGEATSTPSGGTPIGFHLVGADLDENLQVVSGSWPIPDKRFINSVSRASAEIQYTIKSDGTIDNISVLSSTNEEGSGLVVAAVRKMRYSVPRRNGEPTEATGTQKFEFRRQ